MTKYLYIMIYLLFLLPLSVSAEDDYNLKPVIAEATKFIEYKIPYGWNSDASTKKQAIEICKKKIKEIENGPFKKIGAEVLDKVWETYEDKDWGVHGVLKCAVYYLN